MTSNRNQASGVREQRLAAGLTQEKLARAADCSLAYVQTIEGGYAPDPAASPVFRRIAQVLERRQS